MAKAEEESILNQATVMSTCVLDKCGSEQLLISENFRGFYYDDTGDADLSNEALIYFDG